MFIRSKENMHLWGYLDVQLYMLVGCGSMFVHVIYMRWYVPKRLYDVTAYVGIMSKFDG